MCSLAFKYASPNAPWITAIGLLVVVVVVVIGVWMHRRDWAEMRKARKARRKRYHDASKHDGR